MNCLCWSGVGVLAKSCSWLKNVILSWFLRQTLKADADADNNYCLMLVLSVGINQMSELY